MVSLSCVSGTGGRLSVQSVAAQPVKAKEYSYIVKQSYPHATDSYTQGLQYIDGVLWEGTGLNGSSRLMRVDLQSGQSEVVASLDKEHFGEGVTIVGDSIYYLTWRSQVAMLYSRSSGAKLGEFKYSGEGWGLTSDEQLLYMSNGSSIISVRDRDSFEIIRQVDVTLEGLSLRLLNELEWIDGKIWANVYTTDIVVIINPDDGVVEGIIDFAHILPQEERTPQTDYLNGIAYDKEGKRIFVTGKNWSRLFEIEIIEK